MKDKLILLALAALLTSCTIAEGYMKDGAYGPTSFSYEKQLKDTIINQGEVFSFDRASVMCNWIDTLHFFNQGKLYVNSGEWNGKRIVSESWIQQSTTYSEENEGYHFCWYNSSSVGVDKPEYPGFYALGIRGQVLFVNPYKNMIMVRLGLKDDTYAHIPYIFEQLSNLWPEYWKE